MMQKNFPIIWRFLLPVLMLLALAPFILIKQQTSQQLEAIQTGAGEQARTVVSLLNITNELVGEQANIAMRLLKMRCIEMGVPVAKGTVSLYGKVVPNLMIGKTPMTNNFKLVDDVTSLAGGTATLFVKSSDEFLRVATNVRRANDSRATGTNLNPKGLAIKALLAGQVFHGMVDILGEPYITRYDPMYDNAGAVIGAYYVGYKVDMKVLREAIQKTRLLKTGFAVVMDDKNKVRFLSSHVTIDKAERLLNQRPDSWVFVSKDIPKLGFKTVVAYPLSEALAVGLDNSLFVVVAGTVLGALLIVIILWQLRRLILNPIGGDPVVAIDVVRRIAAGDLEDDSLYAKPDTLMANVLYMRRNLRETMCTLRENSSRMSLSSHVFDHSHDGIFITDIDLRIIEVNPAFIETTGYGREDALGKTPHELGFASHDVSFFTQLWKDPKHASEWRGETWNRRKDGEVYAAWLDVFTVQDQAQNISHYVGLFSDITQAKEHQKNLEHMAYHDSLTQLPNRALFSDRLHQALARIDRSDELLAICYFDLDDFKLVNDELGHEAGDYLLSSLSARMRSCLRETDTIARMGGDEFAMLLCGLQSIGECEQTLNRLLAAIKMPYMISDKSVNVSASIGYTLFPLDQSEPDTLLRHADHAMYQAKVSGGSRFHLFDAEHDRQSRGLRQERESVEAALPNGEFCLFYQPKVDMHLGEVVGMEALIRWQHPTLGLRTPADFLPVIEYSEFSITLGEWVILEALQQIEKWRVDGLNLQVSVNVAARHMIQANFSNRLAALLNRYPSIPPNMLELEITETAAIEDVAVVAKTINSCKQLGVSFALDDFGVGYSSLNYLRHLPVEVIKIDQSFIRDMLQDADDLAVVSGVISLSRSFGRQVVAEGVETVAHGVQLLKMGCRVAQGYGIARPMQASSVWQWIKEYKPDDSWSRVLL